jgi:hypothetical protein
MGSFEKPLSWFEMPDDFDSRECCECMEKTILLDKIAVHFIDVLRDLYGNDIIEPEALHYSLEEMAGLLDIDFYFKKLNIDRIRGI